MFLRERCTCAGRYKISNLILVRLPPIRFEQDSNDMPFCGVLGTFWGLNLGNIYIYIEIDRMRLKIVGIVGEIFSVFSI